MNLRTAAPLPEKKPPGRSNTATGRVTADSRSADTLRIRIFRKSNSA